MWCELKVVKADNDLARSLSFREIKPRESRGWGRGLGSSVSSVAMAEQVDTEKKQPSRAVLFAKDFVAGTGTSVALHKSRIIWKFLRAIVTC
jgi:hypothetical protein